MVQCPLVQACSPISSEFTNPIWDCATEVNLISDFGSQTSPSQLHVKDKFSSSPCSCMCKWGYAISLSICASSVCVSQCVLVCQSSTCLAAIAIQAMHVYIAHTRYTSWSRLLHQISSAWLLPSPSHHLSLPLPWWLPARRRWAFIQTSLTYWFNACSTQSTLTVLEHTNCASLVLAYIYKEKYSTWHLFVWLPSVWHAGSLFFFLGTLRREFPLNLKFCSQTDKFNF